MYAIGFVGLSVMDNRLIVPNCNQVDQLQSLLPINTSRLSVGLVYTDVIRVLYCYQKCQKYFNNSINNL